MCQLHNRCSDIAADTADRDCANPNGVDSSWNVMAHGDAREGKWRGNWRMEWVASTLHITSEHGVSSITTADAHTSAASSRLNWRRPADLNGLVRFARKTKSGFCACGITFQLASTTNGITDGLSKSLSTGLQIDVIYRYILLTAIGLTPGGSSTVHICVLTKHRITQWNRIHRTECT